MISQRELLDLAGIVKRDKGKDRGFDLFQGRGKAAVAQPMAAFVAVKVCLDRLPAGVPDGVPILYIDVFAVGVGGNIVVAVAGQA